MKAQPRRLSCIVGCKHNSWRWNVDVIPLVLLNVRGVSICTDVPELIITDGMCEVEEVVIWPVRVNERVEHFKRQIFIVLLTSIITSRSILCQSCKYESFFFFFRMFSLQKWLFFFLPMLFNYIWKEDSCSSSFINGACEICLWFLL